jgi:hypothetical protein
MAGTLSTTTTQTLQTTQSLMQQVGTQLNNSISDVNYNLGNFVTNVSILPFIKSAVVQFDAIGLKPNTRLYAYFGNVPMSAYCAPTLAGYSQDTIENSQKVQPYGTPLYSNSSGGINGVFQIPSNTFKSQEITFKLLDISDLAQGEDAITTEADGVYYGSTLSVAKGSSFLNTRQTVVSSTEVTQNTVINGLGLSTQITQQYVADPPPRSGGSGCGCGCFVYDTKVLLENGTTVNISEIKIGDRVYNHDKTSLNEVKFVETVSDKYFENLYSPNKNIKPFATVNHPIYIDGDLASVDPDKNLNWYPWLGKNNKVEAIFAPTTGQKVYNLWVDGDGTYTVNGFGTTSIIGDGGLLRLGIEQGIITMQDATDIMIYYTEKSKAAVYGSYILNKVFAKLNIKWVNRFVLNSLKGQGLAKKFFDVTFTLAGKVAS